MAELPVVRAYSLALAPAAGRPAMGPLWLLVSRRLRPVALPGAGSLILAAGVAVLAAFVLLGRPPLSLPTLAGLRVAVPLALLLVVTWEAEARLLAWYQRRSLALARWWTLAGYAPLVL